MELTPQEKAMIIQSEIDGYRGLAYRLELRYRVNKKIGADETVLNTLKAEMEKVEAAIDALTEEIRSL